MKSLIRRTLSILVQKRLQEERRGGKRVRPVHRTLCQVQTPGKDDRATAIVQNLSSNGVGMLADREYTPGTVLHALLVNASHTFGLALDLKIVRCFHIADNQYFVAGPFARPLAHDELVPFII